MNEPWITILSVVLVTLGVLAELNLMRIFLRDWREGRREERAGSFRVPAQVRETPRAARQSPLTRRGVAGAMAVPALICVAAFGQSGTEVTPLVCTPPVQVPEARGEFSLADARLSFSLQPQPAAETPQVLAGEQSLTISTNRPSFDDTTGIVPIGHFQLETGYALTFRNRHGVETQTHNAPELLGRIPLLEDRLELQLGTAGYVWSRSDGGSGFESNRGFSDMTVGLRLKVTDQDHWLPRIALQASTTTGLGTDGISNQDVEPTFKFIWSYDLGDGWGVYGNLGFGYLTSGSDRFLQGQGGVCLSKTLNDKWSVYGEYYVFAPNSKGTDAAHYLDFGAAYLITPRIQLDGRVGFGLNQEANNLFTGFGVSFLF